MAGSGAASKAINLGTRESRGLRRSSAAILLDESSHTLCMASSAPSSSLGCVERSERSSSEMMYTISEAQSEPSLSCCCCCCCPAMEEEEHSVSLPMRMAAVLRRSSLSSPRTTTSTSLMRRCTSSVRAERCGRTEFFRMSPLSWRRSTRMW
eukprot:scaffold725_cov162-Ochromonas_danica.AAC.26